MMRAFIHNRVLHCRCLCLKHAVCLCKAGNQSTGALDHGVVVSAFPPIRNTIRCAIYFRKRNTLGREFCMLPEDPIWPVATSQYDPPIPLADPLTFFLFVLAAIVHALSRKIMRNTSRATNLWFGFFPIPILQQSHSPASLPSTISRPRSQVALQFSFTILHLFRRRSRRRVFLPFLAQGTHFLTASPLLPLSEVFHRQSPSRCDPTTASMIPTPCPSPSLVEMLGRNRPRSSGTMQSIRGHGTYVRKNESTTCALLNETF